MQQDSSFQGIETPLADLSDEEFDNGGLLWYKSSLFSI
jgi:hypothetical protein